MTMTINTVSADEETTEIALIERFASVTDTINTLRAERSNIGKDLVAAGIEADEQIKADLEDELSKAQAAAKALSNTLSAAEATMAALDKRIDSGDDTVTPLEAMEADMAVRSTKGKQKPANEAVRKADRAVAPFRADNHLALLAADTIEALVDVPVLIRKRPGDVRGITDAVILSQTEPTKDYGTVHASGRVRIKELGTTGLDMDAMADALSDTDSEVNCYGDVIDYETALWPVTRLVQPSRGAVAHFADTLERVFDAELKRGGNREGRTGTSSWANWNARWYTNEASLDVIEVGKAKGKVVASFGVEDIRPPLYQMQDFINRALSHFETGVHTAAGVLDKITVVEVMDAGVWLSPDDVYIAGRQYDGKFGVTIELDYTYEPVEV